MRPGRTPQKTKLGVRRFHTTAAPRRVCRELHSCHVRAHPIYWQTLLGCWMRHPAMAFDRNTCSAAPPHRSSSVHITPLHVCETPTRSPNTIYVPITCYASPMRIRACPCAMCMAQMRISISICIQAIARSAAACAAHSMERSRSWAMRGLAIALSTRRCMEQSSARSSYVTSVASFSEEKTTPPRNFSSTSCFPGHPLNATFIVDLSTQL
mmetsp:Transcript_16912/g.34156  ORF Transcript_16912/g.34156 Transcript_16912/m.34156 type:complete len:211 (-) Transcript_16912:589-1221(-)